MKTLGSRIREARGRKGLRQKDVAAQLGVRDATISQWETNREKPGRERLLALAALLDTTADDLAREPIVNHKDGIFLPPTDSIVPQTEAALANVAEQHFQQMPQNVPVMGTAAAGAEGEFVLNGEISEYVRRPPGIANAPQVFAIWVTGSSMYPRFAEGELAFVHPGRRPTPGDDVLIELNPTADGARPAFIKRLVKRTADALVVEQFNPPSQITFALTTVAAVFRILSVTDLLGI